MYWIVFALFLFVENFTDMFLAWMPFYYELKIVVILWLVLPMTRGSSYLYRKWIHPYLKRYEPIIDEGLSQVGQTGLKIVRYLGIKGMNMAAQTVVGGAMIGQEAIGEAIRRTSQSEGGHGSQSEVRHGSQQEGEEPFEIIDSNELPVPLATRRQREQEFLDQEDSDELYERQKY
jgi:receptor expression-enhancing protein 1/2/3/4